MLFKHTFMKKINNYRWNKNLGIGSIHIRGIRMLVWEVVILEVSVYIKDLSRVQYTTRKHTNVIERLHLFQDIVGSPFSLRYDYVYQYCMDLVYNFLVREVYVRCNKR